MRLFRTLGWWCLEAAGEGAGGGGGAPAGGTPAGGAPAGGTPTGTPTGEPAADPPKKPVAVFHTKEQLEERLRRQEDSKLLELFGTSDVKVLSERWQKLQTLEDEAAAREREQMTELEQVRADLAEAQRNGEATQAELDELRFTAHVGGICAKLGVRNVEYAKFIVAQKAEGLPDGEELDVEPWLAEQLQNEQMSAALGIVTAPEEQRQGITTSPEPGSGGEPPAPPAGAPPPGGTPTVDAMKMTAQEFQRHLASLGASQIS